VRVEAVNGTLQALVDDATWASRTMAAIDPVQAEANHHDLGRELFAGFRRNVKSAEEGAITWL
jgi:phosphogluconate dehydratase